MTIDELFLETMRDLGERVGSAAKVRSWATPHEQYNATMIAPLLRKLLLDGTPLTDRVNRDRGLPIRFPVTY